MPLDLNALLLDLAGLTDAEIEALGRRRFDELCIWRERFDHGFFATSDPIGHKDRKDLLAIDRVRGLRGWAP